MGATRHQDEVLQGRSRMFGDEARFGRQPQVGTHPGRLIREDADRYLADAFGDSTEGALIIFWLHESVHRHRGRVGVVTATHVQGNAGVGRQQARCERINFGEQGRAG